MAQIQSKKELYKICDNIANEWNQYFISELKSYGLDFDFITQDSWNVADHEYMIDGGMPDEFIKNWNWFRILIRLQSQKVPEDVDMENDEAVLTKFVNYCVDEFINIMGDIKGYRITVGDRDINRCSLYLPYRKGIENRAIFTVSLIINYVG